MSSPNPGNESFVHGYPRHPTVKYPVVTDHRPVMVDARGPERPKTRMSWADICTVVLVSLLFILLLSLFCLPLVDMIYRPTNPQFYIKSAVLSPPLHNNTLNTSRNWTLEILVRNPNRYCFIDYRNIQVTVCSSQVDPVVNSLSETAMVEPLFHQQPRNTTAFTVTAAWSPPVVEGHVMGEGGMNWSVNLAVKMDAKTKLSEYTNYEAEFLCKDMKFSEGKMTPAEPLPCSD